MFFLFLLILGSAVVPTFVQAAFDYKNVTAVGDGYSDVIPRQIVRAKDDRVYMIVGYPWQSVIIAYWSNQTGQLGSGATFSSIEKALGSNQPISVDTAYDGDDTIVVTTNTTSGQVIAYRFSISSHTFSAGTVLVSNSDHTDWNIGTSGVSTMFDANKVLHLAYSSNQDHIIHTSFRIVSGAFQTVDAQTQLDSVGSANHPKLVVSPVDNSLIVVWISESTTQSAILLRTRGSQNSWGNISQISTAAVWTSTSGGINIDQGPSMVADSQGKIHLSYIQDYEKVNQSGSYQYGRIHYVNNSSGVFTDQALSSFTHDPAIAITDQNQLYILGHGHPVNSAGCLRETDMCVITKTGASWSASELLAAPSGGDSYDSSVSVKWGGPGWNRPNLVEFVFFNAVNGNYGNTRILFGAFAQNAGGVTPSPTTVVPSHTPVPTSTHSPTPTLTSTVAPTSTPVVSVRCDADIDQSGKVDLRDYSLLVTNFLKSIITIARADINLDGRVDLRDYSILVTYFLQSTSDCGF